MVCRASSTYEYPKGSGSWFAQICLGAGKSIRRSARTQREAREKLKQLQAEFEQGGNLSAKQPTVSEWCATWLDTFAPNLKPNVREEYEGVIKRYIDSDSIGKRRLDKLVPTEVQAWVNRIAGRVAPQTVRNAHARLHKALEVAVKNNYVPRNVASNTELRSVPKADITPLNFEQVQKLLDTVEGHRWAALYRLAVNLGMREAELFGLTLAAEVVLEALETGDITRRGLASFDRRWRRYLEGDFQVEHLVQQSVTRLPSLINLAALMLPGDGSLVQFFAKKV